MSEAEQHTTEKIQVFLLGPAEIRYQGGSIHIDRRLARSLFYYLAAHHGPTGREELLRVFWNEGEESQNRARLSETLSRIRSHLPNPAILSSDNEMVWLDRAKVYVDLEHFSRLRLALGNLPWQMPPDQPLPPGVYQRMDAAIRLWRAPVFLSGVKLTSTPVLDDWLANTTQRLEITRFQLLRRLAQHAFLINDIQLTCEYATAALEYEPLDIELARDYITCLLSAGMRNDARQAYNKFRLAYRKEFKTEPPAEFAALRKQFQQKDTEQNTGEGEWQIHASLETPFIGRAPVLKKVNARLQQGGVLFLLGESGQGKTRLLKELRQDNHQQMRLLYVSCRPTNSQMPLQPLIEMLRRYVQPGEWQRLPTVWQGHLVWLLPELLEIYPTWQPPTELLPNLAQAYLQNAIQKAFELLAEQNRLAVVVDDVHWADETSLKVLSYLMGQPPFTNSSTLVLSGRSEEKKKFLDTWLPVWRGLTKFEEINLSGLSKNEIRELLAVVTGANPPEEHTQQIAAATAGNPFYILEIVRNLAEENQQDFAKAPAVLPLPASVHSLIQYRIERLSAPAHSYIQAAAILGNPFNARPAQVMQGLNDDEAAALLAELQDYQVIEPVPELANIQTYQFSHDKLAESILAAVPASLRSLLHKKAAQALETTRSIDPERQAAVLAEHWQSGGEIVKAFEYWLRAAENARHLFSLEQAEQAFQQAEKLYQTSEISFSDEQLFRLYASWSEMIFERDDPAALQQLNQQLLEIGHTRRSELLVGVALDGLSDVKMALNEYQEGLDLVEQALPYLKNSGKIFEYGEALMHQGVFLYMLGNISAASPVLQDALDLLLESGDPQAKLALPSAHYHLGAALSLGGQPKRALQHAKDCVSSAVAARKPYAQMMGYSLQSFCEFTLGSYRASLESSKAGIEIAEKLSGWRILGYLHGYFAMSAIALGHIQPARNAIKQTIELGNRFAHSDLQALGNRLAGDLAMSLGALQPAVQAYRLSLDHAGQSFMNPDALFRYGFAQCMSGDIEQGLPLIEHSVEIARKYGLGIIELVAVFSHLFMTSLRQGDPIGYDRAVAHARRCLESGVREIAAISYFCAALLALEKSDYTSSDENLVVGLQLARQIEHPWIELHLLSLLRRRLHTAVPLTNPELAVVDVQRRMYQLYEELRRHVSSEQDVQIIDEYRRLYNIYPA